jgi:hypothetical protein
VSPLLKKIFKKEAFCVVFPLLKYIKHSFSLSQHFILHFAVQDCALSKTMNFRLKGTGFDPRLHHKQRSTWASICFSKWMIKICSWLLSDMQAVYMKSVRSPVRQGGTHGGKYRLQYDYAYTNVYSQVPRHEEEESQYQEDSFCVGSDEEGLCGMSLQSCSQIFLKPSPCRPYRCPWPF